MWNTHGRLWCTDSKVFTRRAPPPGVHILLKFSACEWGRTCHLLLVNRMSWQTIAPVIMLCICKTVLLAVLLETLHPEEISCHEVRGYAGEAHRVTKLGGGLIGVGEQGESLARRWCFCLASTATAILPTTWRSSEAYSQLGLRGDHRPSQYVDCSWGDPH